MGAYTCEFHNWVIDEEDCPVCEGMEIIKKRVQELHKAIQGPYDNIVCEACSHMDIDVDFHTEYPCHTIKALDGEENE